MILSLLHTCKTLFSLAFLPFYTTSTGSVASKEITIDVPHVIPPLKQWTSSPAYFVLNATSRVLLDQNSAAQLQATAEAFAEDVQQLLDQELAVCVGTSQDSRAGDIVLTLDASVATSNKEAYVMEVNERVVIRAGSEHGVFYGTRTLLQLLKQNTSLPGGIACDWPDYPERSLMVDMGRKYFSLPWLESHIRELAYLKYNYFHFHVSDNKGFRLQSEQHPEIVSPQHYTKADIQALITLAQRYHVTIVPEIDMPGHMDTILAAHPELQLNNAQGERCSGDIDLAQEASYRLMQDILEEFLPLFPGPYWHIGADEYLMYTGYEPYPQLAAFARQHYGAQASARDTYLGFVNWANAIVRAHGKVTRVWNDGLHSADAIPLDNNMIYEHWTASSDSLTPQEIVNQGMPIMNGNGSGDLLYYVLTSKGRRTWKATAQEIYEQFDPHVFSGGGELEPRHPFNLGSKLHVWCDYPEVESEQEVASGIMGPLRALALKNWGASTDKDDYASFVALIEQVGHAPGYALAQPVDATTVLDMSIDEQLQ
ncbi:MAG TPA: family 20 glycosylhydrolase [Ktedonobacteraceae bacterium]|jgi:hexosaminidase|nr:family 20 glycosylhydrolase [Ktedonobacteraceae bacterium]